MKISRRVIRKVVLRVTAFAFLCIFLFAMLLLNPGVLYAERTDMGQVSVFHNEVLEAEFSDVLDAALAIVKESELYDPEYALDVCMNDGSWYPNLPRMVFGEAFAYGMMNKVVFYCQTDFGANRARINGRDWNLTQLMAHEMVHCYQYKHYGLKTLTMENWKKEGYAEYISRKDECLPGLGEMVSAHAANLKSDDPHWMDLADGTGCPTTYYADWMLVRYLVEEKGLDFAGILGDESPRERVELELEALFVRKSVVPGK